MRYYLYGGYELPRDHGRVILGDIDQRQAFWEDVEYSVPGLSDACGCYVFGIRVGGGTKPWYVGKAERQSFKRESLTMDKLTKYESAMKLVGKGTPLLYFYARTTKARHAFSTPSRSKHRDVSYLEKLLISHALQRNKNLINKVETKLLREMIVPGMINTPAGSLTAAAREMQTLMGY
ncbi:hypothetical protein G3A56_17595 [Rhizobium oryzihabitans]|jgi:hypothetical protein|uniref:GIY-YIG nuclease family protein n=1 Tax=Rhizobium oryzihabitans TaxID=2267833 RepID=A0A7L5BLJ9_9HYPH|nr:hypothetical protein [Rhizobium oryzihabitans]QCM06756.1 hypothetical protein CFBP6626_15285 [Agrobacterium tumefaciens]QIB39764.1 hypothetical protein G3A56_17595 [Rhizobium oryzihabitans]CUX48863.1 conserved hypothetical protein [Agrobacterium genomosp. 5 str. CFBP 6626]